MSEINDCHSPVHGSRLADPRRAAQHGHVAQSGAVVVVIVIVRERHPVELRHQCKKNKKNEVGYLYNLEFVTQPAFSGPTCLQENNGGCGFILHKKNA